MAFSELCYSIFQITGLLAIMLMSWLVASLILMLVPVWMGRQTFSIWLSDTPKIYELYTAALGLYTWYFIFPFKTKPVIKGKVCRVLA
jgi:hypothetical protein